MCVRGGGGGGGGEDLSPEEARADSLFQGPVSWRPTTVK